MVWSGQSLNPATAWPPAPTNVTPANYQSSYYDGLHTIKPIPNTTSNNWFWIKPASGACLQPNGGDRYYPLLMISIPNTLICFTGTLTFDMQQYQGNFGDGLFCALMAFTGAGATG